MSSRLLSSLALGLVLSIGILTSMRNPAEGGTSCAVDDDGDLFCADVDCDDSDPAVNPGATEQCSNAIDDDCDGLVDSGPGCEDLDGDGYGTNDGDCDDGDPSVYPFAPELDDGVDNDCNGLVDELIGGRVTATGGPVSVSLTASGAGFDSDLWFFGPGTPFKLGSNRDSTSDIPIGSFAAGTELRFALIVHNNLDHADDGFYSGPSCRNLDDTEHAAYVIQSPTELLIGFEDLRGGGDLNYSDGIMTVSGATRDADAGICSLNHFLCYGIKATKGRVCRGGGASNLGLSCASEEDCGGISSQTKFCVANKLALGPTELPLANGMESKTFEVKKPVALCNPAAKTVGDEFTGIDDAHTHLESRGIAQAKGQTKFVKETGIPVSNQFGSLVLDLVKAERLLVPTSKSQVDLQPVPNPLFHQVSHFKCYKAAIHKGTSKFSPRRVQLVDQFDQPKLFDIKTPTRFCRPVDKAGEGTIVDPGQRLLCYQAKPAKGQPKHVKQIRLFTNNQLGPEQVDTTKETELCVPSAESGGP